MSKYDPLTLSEILLENISLQSAPRPALLHYDDSAEKALIPLCALIPNITQPQDFIDHALGELKKTQIHLLLVVSRDGSFKGIVAGEDILGEKPITIMQARKIPRSQIMVASVMTPASECLVLDTHAIEHAKVGHIIRTLKEHHKQYAVVIEGQGAGRHRIYGIFALSELAKQLHEPL